MDSFIRRVPSRVPLLTVFLGRSGGERPGAQEENPTPGFPISTFLRPNQIPLGLARGGLQAARVESPATAPSAPPRPQVARLYGWRRLLAWPLAMFIQAWNRSLRWETTPEDFAPFERYDLPVAFTLWHNRLFVIAEVARRYRSKRRVHALVSASRDGAWLDAFFTASGLACVRGSSSKLGREAAGVLIDVLRQGGDIGITPDGPRGPLYDLKAGAVIVTRRGRAAMVLVGIDYSSFWTLRSWDRFIVPKPFSRVRMRSRLVLPEDLEAHRDDVIPWLKAQLHEINPDH